MSQPTIIIEIRGGLLDAVYSDTDTSIFVINRDNAEAGGPVITGPFSPTVIKADLSKAFLNEPEIKEQLLSQQPVTPYF